MNFRTFFFSAIFLIISVNAKADKIDTLGQPPLITEIDTILCPGDLLYGIYDVPGTYIDTFSINGCDSLSIVNLEYYTQTIVDTTICENDPIPSIPLIDDNGCSQIINITVMASQPDYNANFEICPGDSIIWDDQIFSTIGTYTIEQLDAGGCPYLVILTVSEFEDCLTAIENIPNNFDIKLFPNPANSYLTLEGLGFTQEIKQVEIINNTGQRVLSFSTKDSQLLINTAELQTGIYFAKISRKNSNSIRTVQFIRN